METPRQILRYSIPGSVFLLMAGIFAIVSQLVRTMLATHVSNVNRDAALSVARDTLAGLPELSMQFLVGAIAATIPLGFILYQFYYFAKVVRIVNIVRVDRGEMVLHRLWDEGVLGQLSADTGWMLQPTFHMLKGPLNRPRLISFRRLKPGSTKADRLEYRLRIANNLHGLKYVVDRASANPQGAELKREYTTLSDIYHALGASRAAVLLAGAGYGFHQGVSALILGRSWTVALPSVLIAAAIAIGVALIFSVTRGQTWGTLAALLEMGIRDQHGAECQTA